MERDEQPSKDAFQGTKLDYINSLEKNTSHEANIDNSREKYFITFPYPYMNGKLHLGHLYSFSKADFTAYYKKLMGFNVLLPFAFHCTGMPISASANKLKEELSGKTVDVSVVGILNSLGIGDVAPFTDPLHWIRTFPEIAQKTLQDFHAHIDWRRSFITTDMNPYYDSFVKFQFSKLKALGLITFGKRYSIYCPVDNQPCLDHDRRKGEGIKPLDAIYLKVKTNKGILLAKYAECKPVSKILLMDGKELHTLEVNGDVFIMENTEFVNLKYQLDSFGKSGKIKANELSSPDYCLEIVKNDLPVLIKYAQKGMAQDTTAETHYKSIYSVRNEKKELIENSHFVKIQIPEGEVISRSGGRCVVSLVDQWFIDYGNAEWKQKVGECISSMKLTDETHQKFQESLDWIGKWGVSRSFGLGTRIPWDQQYLIDSLSDSTIYMAFYTIKHIFFSDLYGAEQILPTELLCNELWDYVFNDVLADGIRNESDALPEKLTAYREPLLRARAELNYFYSVDLRVSAKDLIPNHLTFFLFNHVALFRKKYWPRRIFTNGYVMLNSQKMSKSEGNFLSGEDAIKNYGTSATRMCLALCGDTNEDANFEESLANALILKLYTFVKNIEAIGATPGLSERMSRMTLSSDEETKESLLMTAFTRMTSSCIEKVKVAYDEMQFRDVVKFGFYEITHHMEIFTSLGGDDHDLLFYMNKCALQLLYPIIPSLAGSLIDCYFGGDLSFPATSTESTAEAAAVSHVLAMGSKITTSKRNKTKLVMHVGKDYSAWKQEAMAIVDETRSSGCEEKEAKRQILLKTKEIATKYNPPKNKLVPFCMDYYLNRDAYICEFDEKKILDWFKGYLETISGVEVEIIDSSKGEPLFPYLEFS
ncbi:leucyl-tRNA synthetase [Enteropsectra breve]|nr:leucyl-tRNA synthetase [Enteropsectra breve]